MKVFLRDEIKELNMERISVRDLVEKELKLNPEEVLVIDKKSKKLLPPDFVVKNDDEVEVRSVISGG